MYQTQQVRLVVQQVWFRQLEWSLLQRAVPSNGGWRGGVVHMARLVVLHQIRSHDGTSLWPRTSATGNCAVTGTTQFQKSSSLMCLMTDRLKASLEATRLLTRAEKLTVFYTFDLNCIHFHQNVYLAFIWMFKIKQCCFNLMSYCIYSVFKIKHGELRQFEYIWGFSNRPVIGQLQSLGVVLVILYVTQSKNRYVSVWTQGDFRGGGGVVCLC